MDSTLKPGNSWTLPLVVFLVLLMLAALFVGFVPIEDCPGLTRIDIEGASRVPGVPLDPVVAEWKTRRAQHFVSKRCTLCGGTGRVSLLTK
jgi:hypothetical protein